MSIIDHFFVETPDGKYMWTKKNVLSLICFFALGQIPKIKYAIWWQANILRRLREVDG